MDQDTYTTADIALARVDDLARQAVGWIAPIRFGIAQSEAEREAAYRLRYQAVIDKGWRTPDDMPDGLERDKHDDKAIHLLAWDGDALAATARLVFPKPGLILPTEETFGLRVEPSGQVVDAGRFVVARAYSSLEHRVLAALVARGWVEVRAHGFSRVCAAFASTAMLRVYGRMGLRSTILGPPRHDWGADRYPILFDVVASAPALTERWLGDNGHDPP